MTEPPQVLPIGRLQRLLPYAFILLMELVILPVSYLIGVYYYFFRADCIKGYAGCFAGFVIPYLVASAIAVRLVKRRYPLMQVWLAIALVVFGPSLMVALRIVEVALQTP
ncbi:hypothetical protein A3D80_03960 [Candidatus Roizmanbacteria bacterium RIFCSPHIGHO2_02_FULL_40_13b]|uniref:Uncharacterized protein n=1 Tax=Candidatus Roizmanbacteria bacterium RIFCSPHIGHO2_01_FULL_39_24 TaxID=1802032 RepID=A0A1F7GJQ6_9BACT|nr:MAG: hypothetical protein A2799_03630 [Candidatus Roizmanbacteria bacterium RIFCSPHIGHO2_01_FULL_39_24]OGK27948.1 MAG: hypothetical protein A3D80_03960 [Candidatus Roizmanbacteria bacterium RIFCSPHIGHO2_02_FULL_40_13b]OGK49384.1 MAG: hypothetical protein A3A56_04320 [Candidatus Roizmanbacteria bacterium RIFCSPLOWO2_01_FULL_40_32]OGK56369.1 MAG: hypothetical protein A3H83_02575 [Candidatus Roizmanbacteria bacterium RIFCSPLOWO2_02_FULL_39_8]